MGMHTRTSRLRYAAAAALTTGLLVPIAVFAGPGFAHGSASASEYQYGGGTGGKVTICHHAGHHKTVTITVSPNALKGHKHHGDTPGACPATATTTTTVTTTTTSSKSDDDDDNGGGDHGHGKGNGHK